jgi:hypothetical protein
MTNEELLEILSESVGDAATFLADKIKAGDASAADISAMYKMFRDAGGSLEFAGRLTPVGDDVMDSLADIDMDLLN